MLQTQQQIHYLKIWASSYAKADTNSDCTISRADIAVILKNANGKYKVTKDVNGDGKIDLKDSISLSKLLLKQCTKTKWGAEISTHIYYLGNSITGFLAGL